MNVSTFLSLTYSITVSVCTPIKENSYTNLVKKETRKENLLNQDASQSVLKGGLWLPLIIPFIVFKYSDNNAHFLIPYLLFILVLSTYYSKLYSVFIYRISLEPWYSNWGPRPTKGPRNSYGKWFTKILFFKVLVIPHNFYDNIGIPFAFLE